MTYVDDMRASYGRMVMCHMIADSSAELIAMADKIGVARKWLQRAGTPHEHFDVCRIKRASAILLGAQLVTRRQVAAMCARRRASGMLGHPLDAEQWLRDHYANMAQGK